MRMKKKMKNNNNNNTWNSIFLSWKPSSIALPNPSYKNCKIKQLSQRKTKAIQIFLKQNSEKEKIYITAVNWDFNACLTDAAVS